MHIFYTKIFFVLVEIKDTKDTVLGMSFLKYTYRAYEFKHIDLSKNMTDGHTTLLKEGKKSCVYYKISKSKSNKIYSRSCIIRNYSNQL